MGSTGDFYGSALAAIHDADYSFAAQAAARYALTLLPAPQTSGPIVDLGCGSGTLAEPLVDHGYDVRGHDISPSMVRLARERVPAGTFVVQSVYDWDPLPCQAVVAIGEVFNYAVGERDINRLVTLLQRISASLLPGGFLLFDVAQPGRVPGGFRESEARGHGYAIRVAVTESATTLTRDIQVSFDNGDEPIAETHTLSLLTDADLTALARSANLHLHRLDGYDDFQPPVGWTPFIARPA